MCAVSMVYDQFQPRFQPYVNPPAQPAIQPFQPFDAQLVERLVREFRDALDAARKKDVEDGAPDCFDPEKAKLEERVAELERKLAELSK